MLSTKGHDVLVLLEDKLQPILNRIVGPQGLIVGNDQSPLELSDELVMESQKEIMVIYKSWTDDLPSKTLGKSDLKELHSIAHSTVIKLLELCVDTLELILAADELKNDSQKLTDNTAV